MAALEPIASKDALLEFSCLTTLYHEKRHVIVGGDLTLLNTEAIGHT